MREKAIIPLKTPLRSAQGDVHQIVLREPTFDEYLAHGDPYQIAYTADGVPFAVEQPDVIKRYIGVCLVEPKDPATLHQAGAAIAREVKNKLLGFFQPAEAEAAVSETSQTTSPSPGSDRTASTTSES